MLKTKKMMYNFFKRLFDILLSLIGIVFLIPLYIIIRLAYFCTGDFHRIIFSQLRVGQNGKPFKMYKYRSMVINADEELKKLLKNNKNYRTEYSKNHKIDHDPRITKIGRIIRITSIDEFPQFINIFLGQMSVVGNRPYLMREIKDMGKDFKTLVKTKPGLTGYWQVHLRSRGDFKDRIRMDLYYSSHACFKLDCKLFFSTFITLFSKSQGK